MQKLKIFILFLLIVTTIPGDLWAIETFGKCSTALQDRRRDDSGLERHKKYFKDLEWLLENSLLELRKILSPINNELGTQIEVAQTRSFLKNVMDYEGFHLSEIDPVENSVIYGSTNVPLYTLVAQVFLVGSFSKNVWVRTPEATRDIYLRLFKHFADHLPLEYSKNIHLITDPSDLSYDVFNRIYVMGLNRNGNHSVRPPADLVVLTGKPETARTMIDRNLRNLKKLSSLYPDRKQLFLGFLAGVNPSVVVPSARENKEEVISKLLFPFLVNAGQDCLNSDIIFLHKSLESSFLPKIMEQLKQLPQIQNQDRARGISPVTMAKNFNRLLEYKDQYRPFLKTPDAKISPDLRRVEPHVFVFPFSEFKTLHLQEHFAPFMTIVTYDNPSDLEQVVVDPRISKKAMYALIYGGQAMSSDLERARDIFRKAQHSILTNSHLFEEFEMNMPFGGLGTDTNLSLLAHLGDHGELQVSERNRPMLISKEVFDSQKINKPNIETEKSTGASNSSIPESKRAKEFIRELQSEAHDKGFWLLRTGDYHRGLTEENKKLYGVPLALPILNSFYFPDYIKSYSGVVLHSTEVNDSGKDMGVKGTMNPMLGDQSAFHRLNGSKLEEFNLTKQIDPSLMPGTQLFTDTLSSEQQKTFETERLQLNATLLKIFSDPNNDSWRQWEQSLNSFISTWLKFLQQKYPEGAYFKNFGEYGSGDLGNSITTFAVSPQQVAREFVLFTIEAQKQLSRKTFTDQVIQQYLFTRAYANATRFVLGLLQTPKSLLVQPRLNMLQTDQGAPLEFRVDFIRGVAIHSRIRFGNEFYPEHQERAKRIVQDFFDRAPEDIQTLSGGADVGFTTDGRPIVFEWNFGTDSGTLEPGYYPFEANEIFSYLSGKKTWLWAYAQERAAMPAELQNHFLKSLPQERPLWWRTKISDISQVEWAAWLRNQKLLHWMRSPSPAGQVEALRHHLETMMAGLGSHGNLDFVNLRKSADSFISRHLFRLQAQPPTPEKRNEPNH